MSDEERAEITTRHAKLGLAPMPPSVNLQIERDGRSISLTVMGDPVDSFSVDHASPWDLLPFVEVFSDLAPFAIYDPQRDVYFGSQAVRHDPPSVCEPPFRIRGDATAGGTLELVWGLEPQELGGFYQGHVLSSRDHLLLVTGAGVSAIDPRDGKARWSWEIACGRGRPVPEASRTALSSPSPATIQTSSASTRKPARWCSPSPSPVAYATRRSRAETASWSERKRALSSPSAETATSGGNAASREPCTRRPPFWATIASS